MSVQKRIARNVIWNWLGTATHMVAGFVIFPILIQRLGVSDCGLWLLIVSLTGYFDLLDLGLRGSMGRNIAFHLARDDEPAVNSVFNTGLAWLSAGALLVMAATAVAQMVFFDLFAVRPEAQADVHLAVWIIGLNLALIFPSSALESVLWGHERFDMINWVDIPCVILRSVLTIMLIQEGFGAENLVTLALIIVGITVLRGLALALLAYVVHPTLHLSRRSVRLFATRELFDVGIWCFLLSLANVISQQLGPTLIGNRFTAALVTPFSAASRLVGYVRNVLMAGAGVLTPLTTSWHAANEHDKQRRLFITGGKLSLTLALFFLGGFWFLGDAFLRLWTGHVLDFAWRMLIILMLGDLLPMSQRVTFSTVLGMNRHRLWAIMSMVEVALIVVLAFVFLWVDNSILSITLAIAIPGAVCRGLVQMVYACRLLNVPIARYVSVALAPAVGIAAGPTLALAVLTSWLLPETWLRLIILSVMYAVAFAAIAGLLLVGPVRLRRIATVRRRRWSSSVEEVPPATAEPTFGSAGGTPILR